MLAARRYEAADAERWNAFVASSKNGVFLADRSYLEYHSDRFEDHSLIFEHRDEIVAVLPANRDGDVLHSHQGLTFGGLITGYRMKAALMLEIVEALLGHCREAGIARVVYKAIPHIYHRIPADEDLYALWRHGAALTRRDIAFTVDQRGRRAFAEDEQVAARDRNSRVRNRLRNVRRARESGVVVEQTAEPQDLRTFVGILGEMLMAVHGARPVHTYDELQLLFDRFPNLMKLYVARSAEGQMLAGAVIYESNPNVAHAQYSANLPEGRKIRALDVVFEELLTEVYADWPYFDFGTSVRDQGRTLNDSLAEYKESHAAHGVTYDVYELGV